MEPYDPACERTDVAIKAVWRLFLRGHWEQLKELGLVRRHYEARLEEASDHTGRLVTEGQVLELLQSCPFLLPVANEAIRRYQEATFINRFLYYREETA
jgi:hypothetical protein